MNPTKMDPQALADFEAHYEELAPYFLADWIAVEAMKVVMQRTVLKPEVVAQRAYDVRDAMLAERANRADVPLTPSERIERENIRKHLTKQHSVQFAKEEGVT